MLAQTHGPPPHSRAPPVGPCEDGLLPCACLHVSGLDQHVWVCFNEVHMRVVHV